MCDLSKDISFFKFQIVTIFGLNYTYVGIICVLFLYFIVIKSRLRSQLTFVLKFWFVLYLICAYF